MIKNSTPFKLKLSRDLTKHIKRGNPWVFSDVLQERPKKPAGTLAHLYSPKDEFLGTGYYCPNINLSFRMVVLGEKKITPQEITQRMERALSLKRHLYRPGTQDSFRLFNGEGDLLPGLVCDVYASVAVLKLDGEAANGFWNPAEIAQWLMGTSLGLKTIYLKRRNNEAEKGEVLVDGGVELEALRFHENGVLFETHLIDAAKTGFFLDQRDNRALVGQLARDKTLLNLFGYTGGFSVFAGLGGATQVTTVDIAEKAIAAAQLNWDINGLTPSKHEGITADAFKWVVEAKKEKRRWDFVITDPPSFAPNAKSVESAKEAYINIFSDSIKLVAPGGLFAASSCSGHISFDVFVDLVRDSLGRAGRRGRVIMVRGQPEDHTWPLALEEMRYLKFVLVQVSP
ncbi:MAG: class I SAM-dependent rRNA methyltransferase [Bacteriovoracia bacterium]